MCLRYETTYDQNFLHEAEMANILRHKNILALYGVVIASSYLPSVALVSYLYLPYTCYSCKLSNHEYIYINA